MSKQTNDLLIIITTILVSSFLLYLPFLLKLHNWFGLSIPQSDFHYVYRNFDGLMYLVVSKTFYSTSAIRDLGITENTNYFPAHLPLYPFFIWVFSFIGYLKSMIFVNILFTILLSICFYLLLKRLKITTHPLILTIVLLFLPRFLVVRSIGAPESLCMLFIILSLYFFEKGNYWLAGLLGGIATMTRVPAVLLFPAYILVFLEHYVKDKKIQATWFSILLIPAGLLTVFYIYYLRTGDFWAYYHTNAVVPMGIIYSVFNNAHKWVGTIWLEDILFYFFLYALSTAALKDSKYRSFYYFSFVYLMGTMLVQHRDIARYSMLMWPLACIAFEKYFTSKRFMVILIVLMPAIYMYGWNFLIHNVMPVIDWRPYI